MQSGALVLQEREASIEAGYERLLRLIDELPRSAEARKQAEQIKARVDAREKEVEAKRKEYLQRKPPDFVAAAGLFLSTAEITVSDLEVIVFYDAVLTRAKQVQTAYDTLYGVCRWVTYFLYLVGWSLALYGRMNDVEGLSEPE